MPRLPTIEIRRARSIHPFLPLLLRPCRDLPSARNELRWLREYVEKLEEDEVRKPAVVRPMKMEIRGRRKRLARLQRPVLLQLCKERALGKPLQYILGSQPFGDLDILCRNGVLIPRPETENYTVHLAKQLIKHAKSLQRPKEKPRRFRVLDICSGSGCIGLLLHSLLAPHFPKLSIVGVDISDTALGLARRNLAHNILHGNLEPRAAHEIKYARVDMRDKQSLYSAPRFDLIICNPPYITERAYFRDTARSVRNYEPKLALVPTAMNGIQHLGYQMYTDVFRIAERLNAKILLCELGGEEDLNVCMSHMGDLRQSKRDQGGLEPRKDLIFPSVRCWDHCEVWCDDMSLQADETLLPKTTPGTAITGPRTTVIKYETKGSGNPRAFLAWSRAGSRLLGKETTPWENPARPVRENKLNGKGLSRKVNPHGEIEITSGKGEAERKTTNHMNGEPANRTNRELGLVRKVGAGKLVRRIKILRQNESYRV